MFDFGALPPEINSGRMYAGPGSGPMMAAAAGWDALAAELGTAAAGYGSVITELTNSPWVGPASAAMAAATSPHVAWMNATAAQAEQAAMQARAAAAAFETAFAMTVPPPVIAANRALLLALIATNFFGQNTPAIMATEAQYMEMWAQDAAAMYGYAASAATASALNPFSEPPKLTNPNAAAGQAAAVGQAAATPAGNSASTVAAVTPMTPAVVAAQTTPLSSLQDLINFTLTYWGWTQAPNGIWTGPSWLFGPTGIIGSVLGLGGAAPFNQGLANAWTNWPYFPIGNANFAQAFYNNTLPAAKAAVPSVPAIPPGGAGALGAKVAASFGQGNTIGKLSVPQGWPTTTPVEFTPVSAGPGSASYVNATATNPGTSGMGVPLTGGAGRRGDGGYAVKYGFRYNVLTRPPSAG